MYNIYTLLGDLIRWSDVCIMQSNPGLPPREETTEIIWVRRFLDQLVHLPANTQRDTIFDPLQFFL